MTEQPKRGAEALRASSANDGNIRADDGKPTRNTAEREKEMTISCYWISTRNRQYETINNADTTNLDKAIEVAKEKIAELKKYNESATVRVIKADGTFRWGRFVMEEYTAETIRTYRVRRKSH